MNIQAPANAFANPAKLEPRSFLQRCAQAWDRFFFYPADPATLGLIRICCGSIALYTVIAFSLDLQQFFGKHAWLDLETRNEYRYEAPYEKPLMTWDVPVAPDYSHLSKDNPKARLFERWGEYPEITLSYGHPLWSIWFDVTDPTAMALVQTGIIFVTFLFMIGLFTRVTSVLTWFSFLGYLHRSPITVFGVDAMMAIALLYLMIGPSGAAFSVDRLLRRWWLSRHALAEGPRQGDPHRAPGRLPPLPVTPSVSANLAIRLMQTHVCIIYGMAGLSKLQGNFWWTGEAIWGTLANFEFAPMQYPIYTAFLAFLSEHRPVWETFMNVGTVFTLAFEIGFPFLIWGRRTRWVVIAMAVALHGGIGLFMGLKTFSLMMLTLVLAFVPPETVRRLLKALSPEPAERQKAVAPPERRSARPATAIRAMDR